MDRRQMLLGHVAEYYSAKLERYGPTPMGVDWNGEQGQIIRFEQLTKIIMPHSSYSVNDLGCGYGALLHFMKARFSDFSYHGWDISKSMVDAAQTMHQTRNDVKFSVGAEPTTVADYGIACGLFNVKMAHEAAEWTAYIESVLDILDRTSQKGFAFNCLTAYSDPEKMRSDLYYADPCAMFDRCKRLYSRNVALLHDYGLYEFTILVRKNS